jgi:hypothetical protein
MTSGWNAGALPLSYISVPNVLFRPRHTQISENSAPDKHVSLNRLGSDSSSGGAGYMQLQPHVQEKCLRFLEYFCQLWHLRRISYVFSGAGNQAKFCHD